MTFNMANLQKAVYNNHWLNNPNWSSWLDRGSQSSSMLSKIQDLPEEFCSE